MKCELCGNNCEQVQNGMRKYCSRRCLEIARQRRLHPILEPKNCTRCGKLFQPKSRRAKFCSQRCKCLEHATKRRARLKQLAIDYLGGKCQLCGYMRCKDALEFHHRNPDSKEFQVTDQTRSWARIKIELDKCDLVCANCHRELHNKLFQGSSVV